EQKSKRTLEVKMDVPAAALYKAYHMPGRFDKDFYAADLVSDVLGRGDSSRLYQRLVKDNPIFNSVSAFTMGTIDPGLLIINGRVRDGMDLREAEKALDDVVYDFVEKGITDEELEKVKNQALSTIEFGEVEVLNRAMNLAFSALSGDANLVNRERGLIEAIESKEIDRLAQQILKEENVSVLYYNTNN
ncbi:MAG: insulinase family protein, partial [Cyclobacteriaceae bacterium]|nr:insulinase family protein [Cyclobacteriaceae bacterium]